MYHPKTPAGILMWEHKLILRMIAEMRAASARAAEGDELPPGFVDTAVDFVRSYADRCHHGKEEDILFRDLAEKDLASDRAQMMQELVRDHVWARAATRRLVEANDRYGRGDDEALDEVLSTINELTEFYPVHIEKEDHAFFKPAMAYFSADEQAMMAQAFDEFDRMLIHERYSRVVEELESRHG